MAAKAKQKQIKTERKDNPLFSDFIPFQKRGIVECDATSDTVEPKKNLLFDMIDSIFVDKYAYKKYTKECIKQNAFMINRIMSIQYPTEARMLDRQNTSPYAMYFLWNSMLWNGKRKEMWVFTKGSKKAKDEASNETSFSEKTIEGYCNYYNIERVQFDDAFRFFPEEMVRDVNAYVEHMKSLE